MDLKELFEQRDAAEAAFREFAEPIVAEGRAMTEDEVAKKTELRGQVDTIDARIKELAAEKARENEIAEARKALLGDGVEVGEDGVRVKSEPRTYGEGSPNSYVADFVRASSYSWKGHEEAKQRLNRWSHEVAVEIRNDSAEGRRALSQLRESHRSENGIEARTAIRELESRAMDTGSGSGGSFVTPVYDLADYAPYRQFNRPFADRARHQDLPEYGMAVFIPAVQGPAGVAAQGSQNTAIQETDPTAGYLTNTLTTQAGQVTISQQLLDRAGPNFQFDKMVFDQLHRDYDVVTDKYVITQAIANAGTGVTYAGETEGLTGTGSLYSVVGAAKAATVDAAGVALTATDLFAAPINWEWFAAQVDSQKRLLIVPSTQGQAFNAAGNAEGSQVVDGTTGYRVSGLSVSTDGSIPVHTGTPNTNQVVVAAMPEVFFWEGALVPRTLPQTLGNQLSVLLQLYAYQTVIVRYPLAVQVISGFATAPTF